MHRRIVALSLLMVIFNLACTMVIPFQIQTATPLPTLTPLPTPTLTLPPETQCGIGVEDHNVRGWFVGNYARQVCDHLIVNIKAGGNQAFIWDPINVDLDLNYEVVCSDAFIELKYEVIDTGSHTYGTEWCDYVQKLYGISSTIFETPDIFGLLNSRN